MSGHGTPIPMKAGHANPLTGTADVPGDKSISHRSLMFGAMAVGKTEIFGLLEGEDVLDTAKAMRAFGAEVTQHGPGHWTVHGVGVGGLAEPDTVIDCGNSGTGVRLIMGMMATSPITATFTGDASLNKRPMARITDPLALFGAQSVGAITGAFAIDDCWGRKPRACGISSTCRLGAGKIGRIVGRPECARQNRSCRTQGDARSHGTYAARLWCRING